MPSDDCGRYGLRRLQVSGQGRVFGQGLKGSLRRTLLRALPQTGLVQSGHFTCYDTSHAIS